MAKASPAEEPSMEEILASIRRIISDEEAPAEQAGAAGSADLDENPADFEVEDDMGDATEMSQDDLDKLFDMDGGDDDLDEAAADNDMEAAMAAAEEDEEDVLELTEDLALSEDDVAEDEIAEAIEENDVTFAPEEEDEDDEVDMASAMEALEVAAAAAPARPAPKASSFTSAKPVPAGDLPDMEDDDPLTSDQTGEAVNAAFSNLASLYVGNAQTVEDLIKDMLRPMLKAWLDQNLPVLVEQLVQKEIERVTRRR
ncbi:PopZ family protein [Roseibium suaedae]|uniref:DUF2497 domain-containing protein n=1 Tax=Roseibium suaedae TaxID=735517 RepID=A0A1M7F6R8_9HYPH|nr:DUF2497 domain-containing protein [Roseibium suaedae]SHL99695.1 hypothetical protein SAMN05444272_1514 [Roseibium suaedae]